MNNDKDFDNWKHNFDKLTKKIFDNLESCKEKVNSIEEKVDRLIKKENNITENKDD